MFQSGAVAVPTRPGHFVPAQTNGDYLSKQNEPFGRAVSKPWRTRLAHSWQK